MKASGFILWGDMPDPHLKDVGM